ALVDPGSTVLSIGQRADAARTRIPPTHQARRLDLARGLHDDSELAAHEGIGVAVDDLLLRLLVVGNAEQVIPALRPALVSVLVEDREDGPARHVIADIALIAVVIVMAVARVIFA